MKHLFALAAAAAFSFFAATSVVFSADKLGGNCCADLEERVAELEAVASTKDQRRLTVVFSGSVSKALWFVDGDKVPVIADNANSPSRFAITGSGKIDSKWKAGYQIEVGAGEDLALRKSNLWLEGPAGRITLGRQSMATDGISEISLANTSVAALPSLLYGPVVDGIRDNAIRFDSTSISGFTASAAWSAENVWDAALRYAGEDKLFRVAYGVGFARSGSDERWSGSASVLHLSSGLFVNGVYGRLNFTDKTQAWHVQAGLERNIFGVGKTTLFAETGRLTLLGLTGEGSGFGAVQAINAANMDLFAAYRRIDGADIVGVGSRIKF